MTKSNGVMALTDKFIEAANRGLYMVIDEVHGLKNSHTKRIDACLMLIHDIINNRKNSNIGLLSATPGDKNETVNQLVQLIGIMSSEKLFNYDRSLKKYDLYGLDEVKKWCQKYGNNDDLLNQISRSS
jgi:ERCC4-related helicase